MVLMSNSRILAPILLASSGLGGNREAKSIPIIGFAPKLYVRILFLKLCFVISIHYFPLEVANVSHDVVTTGSPKLLPQLFNLPTSFYTRQNTCTIDDILEAFLS